MSNTPFTLSSPDLAAGAAADPRFEFNGFGCSGQNQSPVLQWSGAPAGTKSFALTVYDPDAPTGSGWWHWFVLDIAADTTQLAANAGARGGAQLPKGARHVRNDYGLSEFGGFCPHPATSRIATSSRCTRCRSRNWRFPMMRRARWPASW